MATAPSVINIFVENAFFTHFYIKMTKKVQWIYCTFSREYQI